jgi:hypothetical protein
VCSCCCGIVGASGISGDRPIGAALGVVTIGVPPLLGVAGRDGMDISTPTVGVPEARRATGGVVGFPGLLPPSFFAGVAPVSSCGSSGDELSRLVRFLRGVPSS